MHDSARKRRMNGLALIKNQIVQKDVKLFTKY